MKASISRILCLYNVFLPALVAFYVLVVPVFALRMTEMPKEMQTQIEEPRDRTIDLKLPLLQPIFHWTFMSRDDLLSGRLILRIIRGGRSSDIVIFENGQFTEGWEAMLLPPTVKGGEIYFGFISHVEYSTAPGDKLVLELTVKKDLPGIGPRQSGILPAGKYTSKGTYSGLIDDYNTSAMEAELVKEGKMSPDEQKALLNKLRSMCDNKAFLELWEDQWSLKITSETGWLSEEKAKAVNSMLENLDQQDAEPQLDEQLHLSSPDPVVVDEQPSRSYLWCWIAVPVLGLFVAIIFILRFLKKP
jgi:hypothetical protein